MEPSDILGREFSAETPLDGGEAEENFCLESCSSHSEDVLKSPVLFFLGLLRWSGGARAELADSFGSAMRLGCPACPTWLSRYSGLFCRY